MAIDDFGTGHSSFGYLSRFPFDIVKIDQSFVHGIDGDAVKSAIVSAVVALAQTIDATTVGEGVESRAQLHELTDLGCDVAQGSLLLAADVGGRLRQDAHGKCRRGSPPVRLARAG